MQLGNIAVHHIGGNDLIAVRHQLFRKIASERSVSAAKGAFAVFSAGTVSVFAAERFKAMRKLLYAAGVCTLDTCLVIVARKRKKYAAIPVFILSFVFVLAMGKSRCVLART